jgi:hypothetical protein
VVVGTFDKITQELNICENSETIALRRSERGISPSPEYFEPRYLIPFDGVIYRRALYGELAMTYDDLRSVDMDVLLCPDDEGSNIMAKVDTSSKRGSEKGRKYDASSAVAIADSREYANNETIYDDFSGSEVVLDREDSYSPPTQDLIASANNNSSNNSYNNSNSNSNGMAKREGIDLLAIEADAVAATVDDDHREPDEKQYWSDIYSSLKSRREIIDEALEDVKSYLTACKDNISSQMKQKEELRRSKADILARSAEKALSPKDSASALDEVNKQLSAVEDSISVRYHIYKASPYTHIPIYP